MLAKEAARRREDPTPAEAAEAALEAIVTTIEVRVAAIDLCSIPAPVPVAPV